MLSIGDIKRHSFSAQKSGKFYDSAEVDSFFAGVNETLDALTGAYEKTKRDNEELINKIKILSNKVEEYKSEEDTLRSALLVAQRAADTIIKDARNEASKILDNAKSEAESAISSIKSETDEYVKNNREEADNYLASAKAEYENAVSKAEKEANEIVSKAKAEADYVIAKAKADANAIGESSEKAVIIAQDKLSSIAKITTEFKSSVIDIMNQQIKLLESIEIDDEIVVNTAYDEVYHPEYTSEEYNTDNTPCENDAVEEPVSEVTENVDSEAETETVSEYEMSEITDEDVETDSFIELEDISIDIEENAEVDEAETDNAGIPEYNETPIKDFEEIEISELDEDEDIIDTDRDYFDTLMERLASREASKPVNNVFTPIMESGNQEEDRLEKVGGIKFGSDYNIFDDEDESDDQKSFFGRIRRK